MDVQRPWVPVTISCIWICKFNLKLTALLLANKLEQMFFSTSLFPIKALKMPID